MLVGLDTTVCQAHYQGDLFWEKVILQNLTGVGKWLRVAACLKLRKEALLTVSTVLYHAPDTELGIPKSDALLLL